MHTTLFVILYWNISFDVHSPNLNDNAYSQSFFPFGDCILLRGMLKSCLLPAHHIIRAGKCGTVEQKSTPRLNHCAPSTFSCLHESLFCPFFLFYVFSGIQFSSIVFFFWWIGSYNFHWGQTVGLQFPVAYLPIFCVLESLIVSSSD